MKWLSTHLFVSLSAWIFFLVAFAWMLKALFLGFYPDFSVYYYGAKLYLEGQNPYLLGQKLFSGYSYPPVAFLLFVPFTFFPFQNAELVWAFLNVVLLCISIFLLSKIYSIALFSSINLLLAGFIFISFPVKFTLGMGQVNILILLLLVASLYLLKKNQEYFSGILLGLSLGIKIFPLLLPLYFIVRGRKKIMLGLISCFMLLAIIVLLFVPGKTYSYFMHDVVPYFFSASWKLEYYSQSLSGFVGRTFGTGHLGNLITLIGSLLVITTAFLTVMKVKEKTFADLAFIVSFLIVATMLVNTFSWQHHFVWLVVPFYATLSHLLKSKKNTNWFIVLFVSYILVSINFKTPNMIPVFFQSHVFYGALILYAMQLTLLIDKIKA